MKQLTVKELIEKMQGMPQDALVTLEGCDCFGRAGEVLISEDHTVEIFRLPEDGGCLR